MKAYGIKLWCEARMYLAVLVKDCDIGKIKMAQLCCAFFTSV